MRSTYLLLIFTLFTVVTSAQPVRTPLLADGSLTGWHVLVQGKGEMATKDQPYFIWEDSTLHALGRLEEGSEQAFAALVTDSIYGSYRLHVEYKWGGKKFAPRTEAVRDAGILFHVFDTDVFWPSGLECQIQEGDTGDAWLIAARATSTRSEGDYFAAGGESLTRSGERYARFSRSYFWERPGWNTVELEVDGPTARFYVNGHHVNTLTDTRRPGSEEHQWVPLEQGHIALQAEGAELWYRNVWVEGL